MSAGYISGGIPCWIADKLNFIHGKRGNKVALSISDQILETRRKSWEDRNDHWNPPFPDFLQAQGADADDISNQLADLIDEEYAKELAPVDAHFYEAFGIL
jgi:hypothetical protein